MNAGIIRKLSAIGWEKNPNTVDYSVNIRLILLITPPRQPISGSWIRLSQVYTDFLFCFVFNILRKFLVNLLIFKL